VTLPYSCVANGPGWADEAIARNFEALEARLPEKWLPLLKDFRPLTRRPVYGEFACGHHGCVYPTADPGVVFKITSDSTEADCVSLLLKLNPSDLPDGIVKYLYLFRLDAARARAGKRLPLYAIGRESAEYVGSIGNASRLGYRLGEIELFARQLMDFKTAAAQVRKGVEDFGINIASRAKKENVSARSYMTRESDGSHTLRIPRNMPAVEKMALLLDALDDYSQLLSSEQISCQVGEALRWALKRDMLLADVHLGNVGLATRLEGSRTVNYWVITDPGHLARLSSSVPSYKIRDVG
jgi:hypothetical protein